MQVNADQKQDAGSRLVPVCLKPLFSPIFRITKCGKEK